MSKINRRLFLKNITGLATAVTAGAIISPTIAKKDIKDANVLAQKLSWSGYKCRKAC